MNCATVTGSAENVSASASTYTIGPPQPRKHAGFCAEHDIEHAWELGPSYGYSLGGFSTRYCVNCGHAQTKNLNDHPWEDVVPFDRSEGMPAQTTPVGYIGGPGHGHASDCATHNGPALPVGECDCSYGVPAQTNETGVADPPNPNVND